MNHQLSEFLSSPVYRKFKEELELFIQSQDAVVLHPVTGLQTFFAREQAIGASSGAKFALRWFENATAELSETIKKRKK